MVYLLLFVNIIIVFFGVSAGLKVKSSASQGISSSSSQGTTYVAEITLQSNNEICVETVIVDGNGVVDTLKLPCRKDKQGRTVVNEDGEIVIGGGPGDDYGILGNKPNSLVVLRKGVCVERLYPPGEDLKENRLTTGECDKVKKVMQDAHERAKEKGDKEQEMFKNIGSDLHTNTLGLKIDTPNIDIDDPFQGFNLKMPF